MRAGGTGCRAVLAGLLLAALASGCTASTTRQHASTEPVTAPPVRPTSNASQPVVERAAGEVAFASPSGNILCLLDTTAALCKVVDRTWQPPAAPRSCQLDWGPDVSLSADHRASFVCASDVPPYDWAKRRRLAYGHDLQVGSITCSSRVDGMTCRDRAGHAFTVSRSRYAFS